MVAYIVSLLFKIYFILLIIRIFSSWIPQLQHTKFIRFVSFYTDPYLNLFRRFIPPLGGIDLSPIVAFILLQFVRNMLISFLFHLGI